MASAVESFTSLLQAFLDARLPEHDILSTQFRCELHAVLEAHELACYEVGPEHGKNCPKAQHNDRITLSHTIEDDSPFIFCGRLFCGRCHTILLQNHSPS